MLNTIYSFINDVVSDFSNILYSYILIILLVGGGLYFTFRTKFVQFRLFKEQLKSVTEKPEDNSKTSSFQALMVSTASRVGTGNIVGVSTAICAGGFGAVFWMWLIAIIGGASAFVESTLAQIFKKKGSDGYYGGPSYYIEAAFKSRPLAIIFSIFLILTYAFGFNLLASYNLQSTFAGYSFYNPEVSPWIIGFILALIVGYCLFGGGKRIVKVSSFLVPVMGILYILVALVIVVLNITELPSIFARIFSEAFDVKAIFGGFAGSCVMYGIKRGLFSNEAGVGSAPNAAATAEVVHPVKQGLVQILSVFLDTILVCSATAFMCMCSGVEPSVELSGAPYVQQSLKAVLGNFGPVFITIAMTLFAFTTLIGNLYYVDQAWFHIFKKSPSKAFLIFYRIAASLVIFIGAGMTADLLWNIADVTMGLMALINIPTIVFLAKYAVRALEDYDRQRKSGISPVFKAENIDLPYEVDCWK